MTRAAFWRSMLAPAAPEPSFSLLTAARSGSANASTATVQAPGVPGSQVFDTAANWSLIAQCVREALAGAQISPSAIRAVSASSMREGMVLYDREGPGDLGLPERRLARGRRSHRARRLRRSTRDLRPRRGLGLDHLPRSFALDRPARAGPVLGRRARRHAR